MSGSKRSHPDPESLSPSPKKRRHSHSSEATSSFPSFSECRESNIRSTVQPSLFLGREIPSPLTPKPTSRCQSPEKKSTFVPTFQSGGPSEKLTLGCNIFSGSSAQPTTFLSLPGQSSYPLTHSPFTSESHLRSSLFGGSSSQPSMFLSPTQGSQLGKGVKPMETSYNRPASISAKPAFRGMSQSPEKKHSFVPTFQFGGPSEKLFRPFDEPSTLFHGSMFSGCSAQPTTFLSLPGQSSSYLSTHCPFTSKSHLPTFVSTPQSGSPLSLGPSDQRNLFRSSIFGGSSSQPSMFGGSSSQPTMFLSSPTQSSQLGKGVKPMETSYDQQPASISAKPAFRGMSHEELRWQYYQDHYRGNNFGTSSVSSSFSATSNSFDSIPPLACGQINPQPQSNMLSITVPSFQFGLQNFSGHPLLLCLNNGPGFGFVPVGQTIPCIIIALPDSASAFPQQNTSPGV